MGWGKEVRDVRMLGKLGVSGNSDFRKSRSLDIGELGISGCQDVRKSGFHRVGDVRMSTFQ